MLPPSATRIQATSCPCVGSAASGGRAALAGKLLKDMGYAEVYNLGGFKDWKDAGGPVQEPVDPGM